MERWLKEHPATALFGLGLGLGGLLFIAWAKSGEPIALAGAVLMFAIAVLGDRLRKAPGGWEFDPATRDRVADKVKELRPPQMETRTAEDSLTISDSAVAVVHHGSLTAEAVIVAADAMKKAASPEELAERIVEYVQLRSVPGLRALSDDRIRLEQSLFGAILRLQTLRTSGAEARDPERLAEALSQIETFWSRPEQLSDERVVNTTVLVEAVIKDMAG